jgi:hypothetical protein
LDLERPAAGARRVSAIDACDLAGELGRYRDDVAYLRRILVEHVRKGTELAEIREGFKTKPSEATARALLQNASSLDCTVAYSTGNVPKAVARERLKKASPTEIALIRAMHPSLIGRLQTVAEKLARDQSSPLRPLADKLNAKFYGDDVTPKITIAVDAWVTSAAAKKLKKMVEAKVRGVQGRPPVEVRSNYGYIKQLSNAKSGDVAAELAQHDVRLIELADGIFQKKNRSGYLDAPWHVVIDRNLEPALEQELGCNIGLILRPDVKTLPRDVQFIVRG